MTHLGAILTAAGLGLLAWHIGPAAFVLFLLGAAVLVWRS